VRVCHGEFCGGCGHHSPDDKLADVEARDLVGVEVGQRVELQSDPGRMLGVMVLVFWVPLMAAGVAAWAGSQAALAMGAAPWVGAVACGLVGLVLAGALVRQVDKRSAPGAGLTIARIVDRAGCSSGRVASEE
jgi:positive regulator of sigma E activity